MRKIIVILAILGAAASAAWSDELLNVTIGSQADAELLRAAGVRPVLRLAGGYLVLADPAAMETIEVSSLQFDLLASGLSIDRLALDRRPDRANVDRFPLLYEEGNLRVFRIDPATREKTGAREDLVPLGMNHPSIDYRTPMEFNEGAAWTGLDLDSLIGLISRDSLESYLYRLEAFQTRLTGTDSCDAAGMWIADRFASFGYDSIVIDHFTGSQLWDRIPVPSQNIVATKVGTRHPDRQIIIGGHYDAVPDCPGADDNGSGTAGVLEIARVLKDIETEMTFIFIAFDSEESWLSGSYHYADSVAAQGANIIYMQNLDMIGHITNSDRANLFYNGNVNPYAVLWQQLAASLVGISAGLAGPATSDHTPFAQNGYDVTFVHEFYFSTEYHQPSDNTDHINFDYMTRMVKASLATAYTINTYLPPATITTLLDVGDGQSLYIEWLPGSPEEIDHYMLHFGSEATGQRDSLYIPGDSSRYFLSGLTEGVAYTLYIIPFSGDGNTSLMYHSRTGTPYSLPAHPSKLQARPLRAGILLSWEPENTEMDFHHYQVIRDDVLLGDTIVGAEYADRDPALGSELHAYRVVAVDTDGNVSDTTGTAPVQSKAAALQKDLVLAVNRSGSNSAAIVDETLTGELMREALSSYTYHYFSDSAGGSDHRVNLLDLIDYGMIVIGAEGARQDDIGTIPTVGGILGDIAYYLSLGGKAIIFGRWGDLATTESSVDTTCYVSAGYSSPYYEYFHITCRVLPNSYIDGDFRLHSDLVGAHTLVSGYPELTWDSAATYRHTAIAFTEITGIPCAGFALLAGGSQEVLYTYNSSTDWSLTEGQPVAWRYLGPDYAYVFFDVPLSFMERPAAVAALQQAVADLAQVTAADDGTAPAVPNAFELDQNFPNPFNAHTTIVFSNHTARAVVTRLEIFNILGQRVTVLVDGPVAPGRHQVGWDGTDEHGRPAATGIYLYRLKTDDISMTRSMILVK